MREELKRYSSIGNRDGILLFCQELITGIDKDYSSVRALCTLRNSINLRFDCAVILFEYLGILEVVDGNLRSKNLIGTYKDNKSFIVDLCTLSFTSLLNDNLLDINLIYFDEKIERFYTPTHAFSLNAAIFRNLLIELEAMEIRNGGFTLGKLYEEIFSEKIKYHRKKQTQQQLLDQLAKQELIGAEGELFALTYEKLRMGLNPRVNDIKLISNVDVCAGYDIISFDSIHSLKYDRFIEVKTYAGTQHFYWSKNEIMQSRLRKKSYYIYLIDYNRINDLDYEPEIICDPYNTIFLSEKWVKNPETYEVMKLNE